MQDEEGSAGQTPHRRAWDLIPWVVGGSATDADVQCVQQHAAICAECSSELDFHRQLQQAMQASAVVSADADAERALQALWRRIDDAGDARKSGESRERQTQQPARRPRWLVAAVLAQAVALAAMAGALLDRRFVDADYQTLSAPLQAAAAAPTLRLVPAPDMTAGRLAALLAQYRLRIVESSRDGTVLGLAPWGATAAVAPAGGASIPAVEIASRLRAEPGVLFAEPTSTTATAAHGAGDNAGARAAEPPIDGARHR